MDRTQKPNAIAAVAPAPSASSRLILGAWLSAAGRAVLRDLTEASGQVSL